MVSIKTKEKYEDWRKGFVESIEDYSYFTDFEKVIGNADKYKKELDSISSFINKNNKIKNKDKRHENVKNWFLEQIEENPSILKCVPILIAFREEGKGIKVKDKNQILCYGFNKPNYDAKQYETFLEKTGIFDLLSNHISGSLYDYVLGVEAGLDTNSRKNRSGDIMEAIVGRYLDEAGLEYRAEMESVDVKKEYGTDVSSVTGGRTKKKFDFVVKGSKTIYGIEVNYYRGKGSKPTETKNSYKGMADASKKIKNFEFIWITDGPGWEKMENTIKAAFEEIENLYCLHDLEKGLFKKLK